MLNNIKCCFVIFLGPVPQEGSRHPVSMSPNSDVHLRICLLSQQKQSICDIWGKKHF
jgi:hypothetical protein